MTLNLANVSLMSRTNIPEEVKYRTTIFSSAHICMHVAKYEQINSVTKLGN